ncbi:MAG: hypothetical protein IIA59_00665 [Candidatus Marinimicrobia bacterium]|nr:hypothetical protein [Candidatus Neomarinimicrobiota bacterium]
MAVERNYGIQLERGDGASPEVFTEIVQLLDIKPPGMSLGKTDTTFHDGAGWETSIPSLLKHPGEVAIKVGYDPAAATHKFASGGLIYDAITTTTVGNWKIQMPESSSVYFTFAGYISEIDFDNVVVDDDGIMIMNATLVVTAAITYP